jgi:serine/threonine-protein kinase
MGEVYRARDTRLGRDVAIKVLPTVAALDPDRLARFDREARLLASLNHPHIATLHGIEDCDGVRALVLELVEGDTLADIIARGPMQVREALRLAGQIADALDAAHAKGVIHRDLKPANIKVTPRRQVKVLDFGLAKAFAPSELDAGDSRSDGHPRRDARRPRDRHRRLHESGTGARPVNRQAHGHLGVRLCALRDADRPACVRRRHEV